MNTIQKSYSSIAELPTQVKFSFDERDQKKWMDAYNSAIGESSDDDAVENARKSAWMSMVDAPSSLAVETWASVEVRDADGELVPISTIAENSDRFVNAGGLMHDSHTNVPVGTAWAWETRKHPETGEDGIVYYFNLYRGSDVFDRARDDVLSGRKRAVSIGAEAPRGGYKCDDRGCYVERDVTDLYEISICETPANPKAVFINVGKDIAKSTYEGEIMRLHVKDIDVHQDYTTCPLQFAKHLLLDITPNVHIVDKRKIIAKAKGKEMQMINTIADTGYPFRYNLTKSQIEVIPDYSVEDAIEEAIGNEWACEDAIGHTLLTKKIPKEVFIDWYERGFIHKFGDMWGLSGDDIVKDNVNKARKRRPNAEQLLQMMDSKDYDSPWEAYCETLTDVTEEFMSDFNLDPLYERIVRDLMSDMPDRGFYYDKYSLQDDIDRYVVGKSSKKKVKKDGGAMGCGCAGASNTVYGSNPQRNRKKRSKKKTTKDAYGETFNPTVGKRVIK